MSNQTVLVLRHGRTDWNDLGRLQGHTDTPLNAEGLAGAHRAAVALQGRGVRRILTSPLQRASHTAQIIGDALGITPESDPRLIERNFGALEGGMVTRIAADLGVTGGLATSDSLPADAESWDGLLARTAAVLEDVQQMERVLIVSHFATISALAQLRNIPLSGPENCEVIAL